VDREGCFDTAERETDLRGRDRDGRLHAYNDRAGTHDADHLRRLGDRSREERVERLHGRQVEHNTFRLMALESAQNPLLQRRDSGVIGVGRHGDNEDLFDFDDRQGLLVHYASPQAAADVTLSFSISNAMRSPAPSDARVVTLDRSMPRCTRVWAMA